MSDGVEPDGRGDVPEAQPFSDGVPLARPITGPIGEGPVDQTCELLLSVSSGSAAWIDVGLLIACLVLLEAAATFLLILFAEVPLELTEDTTDLGQWELARTLLLPGLAIRAAGSILVVAVILRMRGHSPATIGLGWGRIVSNTLLGVATAAVTYVLVVAVIFTLSLAWPGVFDQMNENADRIMEMVPRLDALGFAGLATMIGVYEEILFRGFLMTRLRRGVGSWPVAVVLSTAIFTALHAPDQTLAALVAITVLSLAFSLVTIWRRSIIPAIVGHILFNLVQFLALSSMAGDSWT